MNTEKLKKKAKGALKSKTIWLSVVIAVLGVVVDSFNLLKSSISPEVYGNTLFVLSVLYGTLRIITTKPLEEK